MVRRPVDSSIRSKHTGHVGSSINDGVGGGIGFAFREAEDNAEEVVALVLVDGSSFAGWGVKGSFVISGKVSWLVL